MAFIAAAASAACSIAGVGARAAAARHVASATGRFSTLFPRRGVAASTALPAARTRPLPSHAAAAVATPPPATRLLRRGLATTPDDDYYYHGSMNYVPLCWVDPEALVDPATYFNYGEDLASEEAMWAMYERWCAFHGVERGRDGMLRRFGGFKVKACSIHEFNKSGASYTKQLTKWADHTAEERAEYFRRRFPPRQVAGEDLADVRH